MLTGRNEEAGEEIVRSIRQAGGEASFFRADISKESEVSDLVDATVDVFGGLDVLVNNAVPSELARGPDRADGSVADLTTKQLEALWTPALYGYIWGCLLDRKSVVSGMRG